MIGVYRITNLMTGSTYIGSSLNIDRRLKTHKDNLGKNRHYNTHLQNSWVKYGHDAFTFEVLLECEGKDLALTEQKFIDDCLASGVPLFNMKPASASQKGFRQVFSEEHRINIGKSSLGRVFSLECRAKMSAMRKGKPAYNKGLSLSEEVRAKISRSLLGKKFSLEHRLKIGLANKRRAKDVLARMAYKASMHRHSDEARRKISDSAKRRDPNTRKHSPETIEKLRLINMGRKHTPSTIEKLKEIKRRRDEKKMQAKSDSLNLPW